MNGGLNLAQNFRFSSVLLCWPQFVDLRATFVEVGDSIAGKIMRSNPEESRGNLKFESF